MKTFRIIEAAKEREFPPFNDWSSEKWHKKKKTAKKKGINLLEEVQVLVQMDCELPRLKII